ncbi:hypothetical protein GW17_00017709 [Ensete ventricosum]|nr:hypothetical protein GW17_00017709 [Ensete ventricosum]
MNREWAAVVKKLLDILFSGTVDAGGQSSMELALSENLLHSAVQINSKAMVELLLRYKPSQPSKQMDPDQFLFRPDMLGPSGLTPLHIASSTSGAESILDALTNDPGQMGIAGIWIHVKSREHHNTQFGVVVIFKPVSFAISRRPPSTFHGRFLKSGTLVMKQKMISFKDEFSLGSSSPLSDFLLCALDIVSFLIPDLSSCYIRSEIVAGERLAESRDIVAKYPDRVPVSTNPSLARRL